MSVRPVFPGSPEPSGPPPDAATWVVQPGDTLSGIARQLQGQGVPGTTAELVGTLARLNGIANPDRIEVGQRLTLPPRAERPRTDEDLVSVAGRTLRHGAETLRSNAETTWVDRMIAPQSRPRPRSDDGAWPSSRDGGVTTGSVARASEGRIDPSGFGVDVDEQRARLENALLRWIHRVPAEPALAPPPAEAPRFRQSDPAWRFQRLGVAREGPTLAQAGCAVTACAMALSRIGGTVLTPDALLRHLRASGGFQGPLLDWSAAGSAIAGRARASPGDLDCARLDRELDAGRPVLLRVVHDVQGRSRQHWICITGRDASSGHYTAEDPASGRPTVLTRNGAALASLDGERVRYASDGRMVTFARQG